MAHKTFGHRPLQWSSKTTWHHNQVNLGSLGLQALPNRLVEAIPIPRIQDILFIQLLWPTKRLGTALGNDHQRPPDTTIKWISAHWVLSLTCALLGSVSALFFPLFILAPRRCTAFGLLRVWQRVTYQCHRERIIFVCIANYASRVCLGHQNCECIWL